MWGSIVLAVLFSAVAVVELVASRDYSLPGRTGPLMFGTLVAVLAIFQIIREVRGAPTAEVEEEGSSAIPRSSYITTAGWFAGILVGIYLFGMSLVLPLFVLLFLKLHGWGWLLSMSIAIGIFALIYGVFECALKVILYHGIFL